MLTTPNENDIKGTPNGDDHDAKFHPWPKWRFCIGTGGRFPSESMAAFVGMRSQHRPGTQFHLTERSTRRPNGFWSRGQGRSGDARSSLKNHSEDIPKRVLEEVGWKQKRR